MWWEGIADMGSDPYTILMVMRYNFFPGLYMVYHGSFGHDWDL